MREKLRQINNVRATFRAIVVRFGTRTSYGHTKQTLLVQDVRDQMDRVLTDHVWFLCGKWSECLKEGDEIQFAARVRQYKKGYRGRRDDIDAPPPSIDYRLSHPTKVRKINPVTVPVIEDRPCPASPTVQESLFA